MQESTHRLLGFALFLARRFREDKCIQVAGSLTFTTLLAIVPIITIALTLISAFPVFSGLSLQIKEFVLSNLVPASSSRIITVYMQQFSDNAAKLTAAGILFLLVTSLLLMLTIDHTFNTIWRISKRRPVAKQILIYWGFLSIGPILVGASLSLSSWLLSGAIAQTAPFLLKLFPVLLTLSAIVLLYLVVPNRKVPFEHAFWGGTAAGIAFELMKHGFAWYVTHLTTYKLVYGAFSSIPIFLLWIFLSWLVVLSGAVLTASLPYWKQSAWKEKAFPGKIFFDTLKILAILYQSHQKGEAPDIYELHEASRIEFSLIEDMLRDLSEEGWVKESADSGWILAMDAENISLRQLYRMTVFDPPEGETDLDLSLKEHFSQSQKKTEKFSTGSR